MPEFETPESITVNLEITVGDVRIVASDRADTVVEVRPSDENDESDVQAAQQTRVDYANGELRVTGPKRTLDLSRKTRSVDVTIALPAGSGVTARTHAGDIAGEGRLGECRLRTSAGHLRLDHSGPARLDTAAGHITAGRIDGDAEITTGSGRVRVGEVGGDLTVKNNNGETAIGAVGGGLRVRAANGDILVERAGADVDAKTSNGAIRLDEVASGSVVLGTGMGDLEVGIADGTAAWLEVTTGFGQVRNQMESAARPDTAGRKVEVRGRTSYGDVIIHRS